MTARVGSRTPRSQSAISYYNQDSQRPMSRGDSDVTSSAPTISEVTSPDYAIRRCGVGLTTRIAATCAACRKTFASDRPGVLASVCVCVSVCVTTGVMCVSTLYLRI